MCDGIEDLQKTTNNENYLYVDEGIAVVRRFLQQYYQLHGSDNREQLIIAYHDSIMYSITPDYPQVQNYATSFE